MAFRGGGDTPVGPGEPVPGGALRHPTSWDAARCRPARAGGWTVRWVERTGSTNDDLLALAATAGDRTVLVAGLQTAGRGRLGRSWYAPAGAALTFSVLLRPTAVPPGRRGWIGALLGLAVVGGIARCTGLVAGLKWPNDVLLGDRKVAGILAAVAATDAGPALVAGAGINVTLRAAELPRTDATSLALAGADPARLGREELLGAVLDELAPRLDRFVAAGGDVDSAALRSEYLARCVTLGRSVRIEIPGADPVSGRAVDITADGSIVIDDGRTRRAFAAGDVLHLRSTGPIGAGWPAPSDR